MKKLIFAFGLLYICFAAQARTNEFVPLFKPTKTLRHNSSSVTTKNFTGGITFVSEETTNDLRYCAISAHIYVGGVFVETVRVYGADCNEAYDALWAYLDAVYYSV